MHGNSKWGMEGVILVVAKCTLNAGGQPDTRGLDPVIIVASVPLLAEAGRPGVRVEANQLRRHVERRMMDVRGIMGHGVRMEHTPIVIVTLSVITPRSHRRPTIFNSKKSLNSNELLD